MPQTLQARSLVTASQTIQHPTVTISADGIITKIEPDSAPKTATNTLAATFFDIHTHGGAGHDFMEATPEVFRKLGGFLASHGVGHYLPTTVTASVDRTLTSLEGIAKEIERSSGSDWDAKHARPVGIHLEGPFISHAKRGVHPPAQILPPDIGLFDRFQQAAAGHIRLITIAPEIPGALDLIHHCAQQGVRVSIGHSNATAAEARAGIEAGARSATHTFNAMRPLDHREPGVLGVALDEDALYAELICDGVHVAPELVRLWLKAKGPHHGILVTDSMAAAGMPDGEYTLGTFKVHVADGRALAADDLARGKQTLAGSVLTLDRAVANLQRFTGAPLDVAVRLASNNPAILLGLGDTIDGIQSGKPANFNIFNQTGELEGTMLSGRLVQ
ncbi:N-acetylglucosamine-6-phosphate deacetylase [Edaphobacter sp. 12200R-103]|jgi:N-acetylglucosamine-6-phosphate deacetylase|uniref:N-acetylglucosamine-6-phosphate deacetylase n=1 Tax=Edaphobacter sp. 12200R-103 TaxID=2703788 RepID=UPI00138C6CEE|nr:N-acetylglucosamine-6-phosphate deacetylase [Edaphobacter sp. 12200R-103]QHS50844.1 N-acetylglucosamine-6-phosphate deacetylase [Edaphobacter sp. 12200R-103]